MSSDRKIEANRANAQGSTGPQTEAGKAASSKNARKHGLSSATLFIPEERAEEFQIMYTEYFHELRPIGIVQTDFTDFFEQLIHAKWNLHIARELHARALYDLNERAPLRRRTPAGESPAPGIAFSVCLGSRQEDRRGNEPVLSLVSKPA